MVSPAWLGHVHHLGECGHAGIVSIVPCITCEAEEERDASTRWATQIHEPIFTRVRRVGVHKGWRAVLHVVGRVALGEGHESARRVVEAPRLHGDILVARGHVQAKARRTRASGCPPAVRGRLGLRRLDLHLQRQINK